MHGYQSGTEQRIGSSEILPYDAMPDPEMSRIRITNSARSFYLVTEYLPSLFAGWPASCNFSWKVWLFEGHFI